MSSVRLVFRKRSVSWFWWNPSVDNIRHCFWGSWLFFKAEGPEEAESSRRDFNTEGSLRSKWWSSSHISQCWHTGPYICMVWKFKGMVQKLGCSKGTWWSCILLWTRFLMLAVWQQRKWTHHTLLLNVPHKCLKKAFDRLGIRSGDRNNLLLACISTGRNLCCHSFCFYFSCSQVQAALARMGCLYLTGCPRSH